MPAGLVQAPALTLSIEDEETIRRYLHWFDDDDRFELWQRVNQLDAAGISVPALRQVADDTPGGTIMRQCIATLASRRISDAINASRHDADAFMATRNGEQIRQPGGFPAARALPWRRNLTARIGSAGQWCDRRTHWLSLQDFDLDQTPVALYWRHLTHTPLGLSRAIWQADDGGIMGMFELNALPVARAAADLMAERAVGFSVGTTAAYHEWAGILDPDEWAPSEGRTDLLVMRYPTIREVSVTPSPLFDDTGVEAVY